MTHEDEDIKHLLTEAVPPLTSPVDRVGAVARRVRRHRRRLIGSSALAMAMVVALGVGGVQMLTGGNQSPPPEMVGDSGGQRRWTSCAEAAPEMATPGFMVPPRDAPALPRLDSDFTPDAVVICGQETQRRPDGGQDRVATERRSDKVDALVAALRLPDESRFEGAGICTTEGVVLPWLVLVDADGRWMRPDIPVDRCGKPRPEVDKALGALPLSTVATWKVAEVESAEAAAAGCSQRWKDVLSVETAGNRARPGAVREPFPAGQPVRLCVYEVPKSGQGDGEFAHGTVLPAERRTAIEHALKAAGPAEPCGAHASRFALLRSVTGGDPQTYVELDGCHRIMAYLGGPVIAQGDAALAELIDKP